MTALSRHMGIARDLAEERERQERKWGPQHHPDGTLDVPSRRQARDIQRDAVDAAAVHGEESWYGILLEEVFEAGAEENPQALRKELVQVMAVAGAWIEDIDSRG